jgi:thiamine-phosphate pyrophosphorylase
MNRLYLVTDDKSCLGRPVEEVVRLAAEGGAGMVQLREKYLNTAAFIERAFRVKEVLAPFRIPLIINDRVDVALAVGAEGVHLGQTDMTYPLARKLMGAGAIIGISVETPEQVAQAETWDVDYLGISPVFGTPTKTDTRTIWGLEGIRQIRQMSRHRLVAIGGINQTNIREVAAAGADTIAVVSAICSAADPRQATRDLIQAI